MDHQHSQKNKMHSQPILTGFGKPVRFFISLMAGLFVLLALAGCQQEMVASAALVVTAEPTALPTATEAAPATLPPPPTTLIIATEPPLVKMPSFAAVDPTELEAAQEETMVEETAVSNPNTPAVTEAPSATPIPTFTPPALPFTSDEEHYWLQRPIPEGGTVWTDKVYPYGSTRGGTLRPHHGVEFYVDKGTQVIAAASGTVVVAGDDSTFTYGPESPFYGNLVIIELDTPYEGQPVYNLYGHLSEIYVVEGQHVAVEQFIALSGASGIADGPHLHFEVRMGQNNYPNTYNPRLWLYPFPDYGTVAGRVVRKNGTLVEEAPISLDRVDATTRYLATTSYNGTTVNADPQWGENFVLDDVPMGYYEITVAVGKRKFTEELYVFPYRTNFVEVVIED
jgi:murein DD-endopeptidase MepM/ murein hydrolase activator NlpD